MSKLKIIPRVVAKPKSSSYDQSYLSLLNETLNDELMNDQGSNRLVNDSTRAFLNSTWYKNPKKNVDAKRNVLSLPEVTSYFEVLRRKREFKQIFYTLKLIKSTKIEWVKPSEDRLVTDESGIPEELYFTLNKTMESIASGSLSPLELISISKYNIELLDTYCSKIDKDRISISFLLRCLKLICKSKSNYFLNDALDIIFSNCTSLNSSEKATIKHIAMIRFYQETGQRSKTLAYFKTYVLESQFSPLFVVQFEFERLMEHFILSENEASACQMLQKYNEMGFKLRPENLGTFSSFVDRLSLKSLNKLLLQLYPAEYVPVNNTFCLNDVSNSDINVVLKVLNHSSINFTKFSINLDFMLPKIPEFTLGEELYSFFENIVKAEYNDQLKISVLNLFIKGASTKGLSFYLQFMKEVLCHPQTASLFFDNYEVLPEKGQNLRSFFPALSNKHSIKSAALTVFNYLKQKCSVPVKLSVFDYSVLLEASLQGNVHDDFFYYFYHFIKDHGSRFIFQEGSVSNFRFPFRIDQAINEMEQIVGEDLFEIMRSLVTLHKNAVKNEPILAVEIENVMGKYFISTYDTLEMKRREELSALETPDMDVTSNSDAKSEYKEYLDKVATKKIVKLLNKIDECLEMEVNKKISNQ